MDIYAPYTYLIGWSKLDRWYYGVEYADRCKTANPNNLWTNYFTSSSVVAAMRIEHGEPDVIEVRKVFTSKEAAILWEEKVLQRMRVLYSDRWLNTNVSGAIVMTAEQYAENGRKQSATKKALGKPAWNKGLNKNIDERVAKYAKPRPFTDEHKAALSKPKTKTEKMGRYQRTPESIAKFAAKQKGRYRDWETDRKSTRLNSSHSGESRMPSSA